MLLPTTMWNKHPNVFLIKFMLRCPIISLLGLSNVSFLILSLEVITYEIIREHKLSCGKGIGTKLISR